MPSGSRGWSVPGACRPPLTARRAAYAPLKSLRKPPEGRPAGFSWSCCQRNRRFWEYSCEGDAHPFLFSPDDVARLANIACREVDGNLVRNTCGAWYVKRSSGRRHVADGAFNAFTLELNRSGLEHTLASCCASFCHHQPSLRPKNLSI